MRVTKCDVCLKTDSAEQPVGWIMVGLITDKPRSVSTPFGPMLTSDPHSHEVAAFLLCSPECLSAFAEMESLKAVT